jgi:hypothetical protein
MSYCLMFCRNICLPKIVTMKKIITSSLLMAFLFNAAAQNVGIGTSTPVARLHVADSNVLFTGPAGFLPAIPGAPPVNGPGTRMMWYPDKAAFRVGQVNNKQWDKDSIGMNSFAAGFNTRASQPGAVSIGGETNASGINAASFGYGTTASGNTATSMGYLTVASGSGATSMGFQTNASGVDATSMGLQTTASGDNSTSMGEATIANGNSSTSMGFATKSSGDNSTSMGYFTISKSSESVVIGKFNDTTATNRLFEIGNGLANDARANAVTVIDNGNVGIGETNPGFPLNFTSTLGDKISLWGNNGAHYGFGIQPGLLQIHATDAADAISFGYGSSTAFTERARIINNGTNSGADGMLLKGRLLLQNGSAPLDVNQTPGVWLYKADNSNILGFMGTQNNRNVGFFGGPVNGGWGFVYDAINSRVGIGKDNPTSSLNINGQVTIDQNNFGGYGGLLIKGDKPGNNYPNIAFSVKNNFNIDMVGAMLQGELANNTFGNEAINLGFYTAESGFGSLSQKMVIMGNGNIGLGGTPAYKLHLGTAANGLRIEGPAAAGTGASSLSIGGTGDVVIDKPGQVGGRLTIKENGAIAVGGSTGTAGQVIISNGNGGSPAWGKLIANDGGNIASPTAINLPTNQVWVELTSLTRTVAISIGQNAKLFISANSYAIGQGALACIGCLAYGDFSVRINGNEIFSTDFGSERNLHVPVVIANIPADVGSGTHTIKFYARSGANVVPFNIYPKSSSVFALPQ